jgi:hypothetical protein
MPENRELEIDEPFEEEDVLLGKPKMPPLPLPYPPPREPNPEVQ